MNLEMGPDKQIRRPPDCVIEFADRQGSDWIEIAGALKISAEAMWKWIKEYRRRGTVQLPISYAHKEALTLAPLE